MKKFLITSFLSSCFTPVFLAGMLIFSQSAAAGQVATPVFSVASGKYHAPQSITISSATPDTKIYYTTDNTQPDISSNLFTDAPILVSHHSSGDSLNLIFDNDPDPADTNRTLTHYSMRLKAIAIKDGMENSNIASADYVIDLVDATFNIPYAEPTFDGDTKHLLDIYQPYGQTNTAVLLFIYGGAWKQGDKTIYMELANTFAGYYNLTTVVANYRLSADPWFAVHPEHIQDVAAAFSWTYHNIAKYGGDPERIFVFGQSAGGHLVSLLATDTNYLAANGLSIENIKGVISMSGVYDLYDLVAWPTNPLGLNAQDVLGYKALCLNAFGSWEEDALDAASSANFIKTNQPPFQIIALNESGEFTDMPGFGQEARNFYSQILGMNGPAVELKLLNVTDIPKEVLDIKFPEGIEGHYEEIYAINTHNWNSVSTKMVAEFIGEWPEVPSELNSFEIPNGNSAASFELSWGSPQNTIYYHLQVASQADFSSDALIWDIQPVDTSRIISDLPPDMDYFWRVCGVNGLGEGEWSQTMNFRTDTISEINPVPEFIPRSTALHLFPNPFNGAVTIRLQFAVNSNEKKGKIKIFNLLGKLVFEKEIAIQRGDNNLIWQPASDTPSGLYWVSFQCGKQRFVNRVVYLK